MSDIADVVKEEEKENPIDGEKKKDFPVILVTDFEETEGEEMKIRELPKDALYYDLKIQITETCSVTHNNVKYEELINHIQKSTEDGINFPKKYYVAPIKRRKE